MLFSARRQGGDHHVPDHRVQVVPPRAREAGAYLTDGARLFRVVAPLCPTVKPAVAVLEDCMTLRARVYTADELWQMHLAPVRQP
ncbi:MAG: hypothetical protein ACXVSX_21155 [Solirubrobacteraceae bacterium]